MPDVARPFGRRRRRLSQVVREHGIAHGQWIPGGCAPVQRLQHMHAGVEFRMSFEGLRNAEQSVDFGNKLFEASAAAQDRKESRWTTLHERSRKLLPDAFGR